MATSPDVPVGDVFLQATGLVKSFAGVQVLRDVSLEVRRGEVHAVVGENGAGKSTLMKILAGLVAPDAGSIAIGGAPCRLASAHAAAGRGIAMIHQELLPVPELSVEENVLLGREPVRGPGGWVDRRQLRRRAVEVLERLNPGILPGQRMGDLSVAEMQTVEIARALAGHARLIIMDEPTSALSDREVEALLKLVGELKASGVAVLYITHRLEEVFRVADRVTVLRDGIRVATLPSAGLTTERLIPLMVGREVGDAFPRIESTLGEVLLEVRQLGRRGLFGGVSFSVRAGEVVGLAGLMGSGRSEVLRAIYGLEPADAGGLWLRGRPVRIRRPQDALAQGIVLVTEDRQRDGLVPTLDVRENLTLSSLARCCRSGWVNAAAERRVAERSVSDLGIRTRGLDVPVRLLSGGNQQKVLLGRALLAEPKVLLLDEPTRGIDIGAKLEVYRLMADLARRGMGVVLVSSELPELMALSHRLVVLREGRQVTELDIRGTTADEVMRWAVAGAPRVEGVAS